MDELEDIPEISEEYVHAPCNAPKKRKRDKPPPPPKRTLQKKPKKADLVARYLNNFDSSKEIPPTEDDLKSYSIAKLETLCLIQEKHATHKIQPGNLAHSVISFVSQVLDGLAGTGDEITKLNAADEELTRCVGEQMGKFSTFLDSRVKIASHITLNSGRAIMKKRKLNVEKENAKECVTDSTPGPS
jgi:hypothetical protein